jgi:hypothetical protein
MIPYVAGIVDDFSVRISRKNLIRISFNDSIPRFCPPKRISFIHEHEPKPNTTFLRFSWSLAPSIQLN